MDDDVMKMSRHTFPVMFEKVEDVTCNNERFTKVRVWMMHTGLNYNQSDIPKEVIENAIPTLDYIPIVGFIEFVGDDKDFAGHKYRIVKDEKGIRRKYIGSAYGVIKSHDDNNAHFEMRMCDDGEEREFLVVDGIIWNMFEDSTDIMLRDLIKGHSMEMWEPSIKFYEDENGIAHFTEFSFRAACILGEKCEPAMYNSTIEVQFTMSDFVRDIQDELNDKYAMFTAYKNESVGEGGNDDMPAQDFSISIMQRFDDIAELVRAQETYFDRWGDTVSRYYLVDIQETEVIVVDTKDNYHYYGFAFTMDGDAVKIDFANGTRKKIVYEDYVDGETAPESAFDFGHEITAISDKAFAKVEEANGKAAEAETARTTAETDYSTLKEKYDEMEPKFNEYVRQDEARQAAELDAAKDAEFSRFEEALGQNEDFIALKDKRDELTVDEINAQCSILYTRMNLSAKTNFSKTGDTPMALGVVDVDDDNENYVATKYGNIPVSK